MRFLADENFPRGAVEALRSAGHDVDWIRASAPGAADAAVLATAIAESRILLTFDKDFGDLSRTARLGPDCGVVLLRIVLPPPGEAGRVIAGLILSRADWAGHLSVIEAGRVRMRLIS
jgi:predicted nuclease of predicted toxin-antitoxin system